MASGNEKSVNLLINGGEGNNLYIWREKYISLTKLFLKAFAASVWVNSVFLGPSFRKWVGFLKI